MSNRLEFASVAGLFVGEHDPPEVLGDPAFEAAKGFPGGLAVAKFAAEVMVAGAAWAASLDERHDVQGMVELPVTGPRQPVPGVLAASDLERSGAGVAGEVRAGGKARGPSRAAEQPAGDDWADANSLGEPAAQPSDGVLDPLADHREPPIQPSDLGHQIAGDLLAGVVGSGQRVDRAEQRGRLVGRSAYVGHHQR